MGNVIEFPVAATKTREALVVIAGLTEDETDIQMHIGTKAPGIGTVVILPPKVAELLGKHLLVLAAAATPPKSSA